MNGERLRILVAADARSVHTERFAAELRCQGCDVLIVSLEAGDIGEHRLRQRSSVRALAYWLAKGEVENIIEDYRPDIISAHYAAGYGALMGRAKRHGIPLSLHVWGSDVLIVPKKSWLHRRKVVGALRAANYVFADSRYLAEAVHTLAADVRVSVFPWGIERRHLLWHKAKYQIGRPLSIIVPRAHEPVYDNLFILRALRDQLQAGSVRITFPAFGSRYDEFRREAAGIEKGRVRFYHKLPREEFLALMASHDAYLSAAKSDSSPVSLIEAMALGLLPIAADIPGVREWLNPSSGFSYPPGDEAALQKITLTLTQADSTFAEMRRANVERVRREALFEDNVAGQLAIMRTLRGSLHERVAR